MIYFSCFHCLQLAFYLPTAFPGVALCSTDGFIFIWCWGVRCISLHTFEFLCGISWCHLLCCSLSLHPSCDTLHHDRATFSFRTFTVFHPISHSILWWTLVNGLSATSNCVTILLNSAWHVGSFIVSTLFYCYPSIDYLTNYTKLILKNLQNTGKHAFCTCNMCTIWLTSIFLGPVKVDNKRVALGLLSFVGFSGDWQKFQ